MVYVSPGETDAQKFPLRRDRSIQIKTVQLSNKRQSGLFSYYDFKYAITGYYFSKGV